MWIIIIIACLVIISYLGYSLHQEKGKTREIAEINLAQEKKNCELKEIGLARQKQNQELEAQTKYLENLFQSKTDALSRLSASVDETSRQYETIAKERAEKAYQAKLDELEQDFQKRSQEIDDETRQKLLDYKLVVSKVQDLQAKQLAYIQMKQREEAIAAKQDYYRLVISEEDQQDIQYLRTAQAHLFHKEAIDKIIWDGYIKPAYDVLMSHIFENQSDKACGIYRITCLTTGKSYIGQSVDIRERFRQHIKTALAYTSTTNKLYQEMKKQGIENFTFEILEKVDRTQLNEREVYWIDFCKTKEFGLNGTKGGS